MPATSTSAISSPTPTSCSTKDCLELLEENFGRPVEDQAAEHDAHEASENEREMTTRAASEIVIGPVITERTYQLYTQGRYTFRVSPRASKTEIKKALEEQYEAQGIKVRDVNTVSMRGKSRRSMRRIGSIGHTADWKKAIVTLGPGQKIEGLFGSV